MEIISRGIPKAEEEKGDDEGLRAAFGQLARAVNEAQEHPKYRRPMRTDSEPGRGDADVENDGIDALRNIFAILESEPHPEGEHTGSDED